MYIKNLKNRELKVRIQKIIKLWAYVEYIINILI